MVHLSSALVVALAGLAACKDYTVIAYKGKHCKGEVNQKITQSVYGGICTYFKKGAGSVKVIHGGNDFQWVFFNQYPCSAKSQVGSFIGNRCIVQGATPIKAFSNNVPLAGRDIDETSYVDNFDNLGTVIDTDDISATGLDSRDIEDAANDDTLDDISTIVAHEDADDSTEDENVFDKRSSAGIITSWKNTDCSGGFTNQMQLSVNQRTALNSVGSAKVKGVPSADTAVICSDRSCTVYHQVKAMQNGKCAKFLKKKNIESAIVIGVVKPPKAKRNLITEAEEHTREHTRDLVKREKITCSKNRTAKYKDALKTGDAFGGDDPLGCCCHRPGQHTSKAVGTARSTISDSIQCPADPTGTKPPPSSCPLLCTNLRGYIYSVASKCKNGKGKTGGVYHLPAGNTITVGHS